MTPTRVLLVAQSPVLRYGIRGTLESVFALESETEAPGTLEAAAIIDSASPSLVVIHDALPGVTANATAKMLRELRPSAAIAILSDFVEEGHREAAQQHGADALISTAAGPADFAAAISAAVAWRRRPATDRLLTTARVAGLVADEIAALDGLVRGFSPRTIAAQVRADEQVVARRIASVVTKLGAGDRASAVVAAVRLGVASLSDQLPSPPVSHDLGMTTAA